ncbi:MAG TPA: class IV adenylate cyclase [Verrucomicrobiae bacterium]|nr:class IV adenylate cyclase [Verrucomicrobiae bacterium]
MKTELEVKFANVNIEAIRQALQAAGAVCEQPMRLMKRALVEEPHHQAEHAFLRIRDEGDKTTLTFKRRADPDAASIDSVKELEVEVSDFDKTVEIFSEAGWKYKTFQESKRETWKLDGTEVVIDEWPWLNPYIEIEGESEAGIKKVAEKIGLSWDNVLFGHIDALYEMQYEFQEGIRGVIDLPEVRFNAPLPAQFAPRKAA